ncbi:uncharacterized protein ACA1_254030 [Acanthamoeba castellanii str. Neff]|uniref:Uncharacterized protein n=1 Tax=Acanthamoeba castellanii (strain ATCC 30010 / Neff) TaxID=1257118 RepID=L8HDB5_ACACF|nr:uncharacterized protein ACA1_254030 [Acanthamoeba castellanii str. Neff]ELR22386.1 hypothetical protein ACA1_254030 [Acanthamoeba castellanii str. Neff]
MRVRRWSNFIKFFGFALVVLGFAELVYGVVGGLAWADFVVGGVTVCVGLLGLYAGFRPSIGAAKRYFWALIVVAVLMVTVLVVYIIVLDRGYWEELCEKEQLKFGSNTDCNSNTTRYLFVAAAIVQLVITMGCCMSCLCCARTYYKTLAQERGHLLGHGTAQGTEPGPQGPYHTAPLFSSRAPTNATPYNTITVHSTDYPPIDTIPHLLPQSAYPTEHAPPTHYPPPCRP